MFRDDGGDFGDNPIAKLLAMRSQGSVPTSELDEQDQRQKDALALAQAGTIGQIGKVGQGIKLIPSAYDAEQSMYKKAAENAPSFWQKYGPKPVSGPGGEVIPIDKFKQIANALNPVQEIAAPVENKLTGQFLQENPDLGKNIVSEGDEAVKKITDLLRKK